MVMTPEQAAEVLRRHNQFNFHPDELHAALETAIECLSAKPKLDIQRLAKITSEMLQIHEDPICNENAQIEITMGELLKIVMASPTAHPATPTPTDEQIGEVFDKYAFGDFSPLLPRTAAIPFVREVIKLYFGGK